MRQRDRNQKMSFRDALDLVPDDMPDGAAFALAHEYAGLEYGDGFDELVPSRQGRNGPQAATRKRPGYQFSSEDKRWVERAGCELCQHDAYHFTLRRDGKVVADWWPHKKKFRVNGQTRRGTSSALAAQILLPRGKPAHHSKGKTA